MRFKGFKLLGLASGGSDSLGKGLISNKKGCVLHPVVPKPL